MAETYESRPNLRINSRNLEFNLDDFARSASLITDVLFIFPELNALKLSKKDILGRLVYKHSWTIVYPKFESIQTRPQFCILQYERDDRLKRMKILDVSMPGVRTTYRMALTKTHKSLMLVSIKEALVDVASGQVLVPESYITPSLPERWEKTRSDLTQGVRMFRMK